MKPEIHPENYRLVAFKDMSNDDVFITKSTAESKETIEVDGVTYPVVKLEISRTSHPFYTGKSNWLILLVELINSKINTRSSRTKELFNRSFRSTLTEKLGCFFFDCIFTQNKPLCISY